MERPRAGRAAPGEYGGGRGRHAPLPCPWPAGGAPGRQYGPGGSRYSEQGRRRDRAEPGAAQRHPCDRPDGLHNGGRGRLHPAERGRGGAGGRLLLPALLGRPRQLPDRRQCLHQCRRPQRAALGHDARSRAGAGSGAARRPYLGWAQPAAQGQYRLRPQAAFHRCRRHARHRDGGLPQALSAPDRGRDGDARFAVRGGGADAFRESAP